MYKIGILNGVEDTFPQGLIAKINELAPKNIRAESAFVEEVFVESPMDYAVLIDRISQDVPFYRAILKKAALAGTIVINNPFWWSADDKFTNNVIARRLGIAVPKTALLPSKDIPHNTSPKTFRNLKFPLDWQKMVEHVGSFPLFLKQYHGGGWTNVFEVISYEQLFQKYDQTGHTVMMLQEAIDYSAYFRCYYVGGKVRIMHYEPANPHHLRYAAQHTVSDSLLRKMTKITKQLNQGLGYDMNTVEFAVRDGIPYAIDFFNPAPDADLNSVGIENFNWVVDTTARLAIAKAKTYQKGKVNLTWGSTIRP